MATLAPSESSACIPSSATIQANDLVLRLPGHCEEVREGLEPLVADRVRLQGDSDPETQLSRLWPVNALISLEMRMVRASNSSVCFAERKQMEAGGALKARRKQSSIWQTVTSEDMLDSGRPPGVTGQSPRCIQRMVARDAHTPATVARSLPDRTPSSGL
jgi:hypothetical protein